MQFCEWVNILNVDGVMVGYGTGTNKLFTSKDFGENWTHKLTTRKNIKRVVADVSGVITLSCDDDDELYVSSDFFDTYILHNHNRICQKW